MANESTVPAALNGWVQPGLNHMPPRRSSDPVTMRSTQRSHSVSRACLPKVMPVPATTAIRPAERTAVSSSSSDSALRSVAALVRSIVNGFTANNKVERSVASVMRT